MFIICAILLSITLQYNVHSRELGKKPLYTLEEASTLFEQFIDEYNKEYDEKEKEERFKIFVDNLKDMNSLNAKSTNAVYGINKFSDLSKEEFIKFHTGFQPEEFLSNENYKGTESPLSFNFTAPSEFDWRDKGVVSKVKDQGQCGSCWAFSASGNVESINAIKTGKIIDVSEQQLVDCDTNDNGCKSGLPWVAMSYLHKYGAMSLHSYPYFGINLNCRYDSSKVVTKLKGFKHILNLSEDEIKEHLYNIGPLSIGIAALAIHHYNGHIVTDDCNESHKVNHAVLLVGYGEENGVKYWTIKNSWSEYWGDNGYFRIKRGVNCLMITQCGITTAVI